ncbi:MAG: hypothetical protein IJ719_03420 [Clostridia bacterium]|nr:hypothetical protein [Clostridia bacterium]
MSGEIARTEADVIFEEGYSKGYIEGFNDSKNTNDKLIFIGYLLDNGRIEEVKELLHDPALLKVRMAEFEQRELKESKN